MYILCSLLEVEMELGISAALPCVRPSCGVQMLYRTLLHVSQMLLYVMT